MAGSSLGIVRHRAFDDAGGDADGSCVRRDVGDDHGIGADLLPVDLDTGHASALDQQMPHARARTRMSPSPTAGRALSSMRMSPKS